MFLSFESFSGLTARSNGFFRSMIWEEVGSLGDDSVVGRGSRSLATVSRGSDMRRRAAGEKRPEASLGVDGGADDDGFFLLALADFLELGFEANDRA